MTKAKAIDLLDNLIGMIEDNNENDYDAALHMAMDALRRTSPEEVTMSRQTICDALDEGNYL